MQKSSSSNVSEDKTNDIKVRNDKKMNMGLLPDNCCHD